MIFATDSTMDVVNNLPLVAAIVASQQLLAAAIVIFDDLSFEASMEKKRRER
jgi:hypothetical protein